MLHSLSQPSLKLSLQLCQSHCAKKLRGLPGIWAWIWAFLNQDSLIKWIGWWWRWTHCCCLVRGRIQWFAVSASYNKRIIKASFCPCQYCARSGWLSHLPPKRPSPWWPIADAREVNSPPIMAVRENKARPPLLGQAWYQIRRLLQYIDKQHVGASLIWQVTTYVEECKCTTTIWIDLKMTRERIVSALLCLYYASIWHYALNNWQC